jgi:hypothetical protein
VQRDLIRYNSRNRLATLVVLMLAFSGLVFLLLTPGRLVMRGVRLISISLQSQLSADYSPDLHAILPPVNLGLIGDALGDRNNPGDIPVLINALNTPVPTVTPAPTLPGGFFPTPPLVPTLPGLPPTVTKTVTATLITPTITSTFTSTAIFTPTFTPTGGSGITPVVTTATPTRTPTRTPTTPLPPPTSTRTPVPTSTHTDVPPPTSYPAPPTKTPRPTNTPVTPPPGVTPPTEPPPTEPPYP